MTNSYSEGTLVEQPAIALFEKLEWDTENCFHETFGYSGTLGRETSSEVVLTTRLRPALERLNPTLPAEALTLAIEELTRDRSLMTPVQANREIYQSLKNGVKVTIENDRGEHVTETVRIIDWQTQGNNDFLLASQFWVTGEMYKRRCDLVGFVNGLPLVFIELKASHKKLENAFRDNLKDYKETIPQLFWYNALIILSNGSQSRIGSLTAEWEHFADWKKSNNEGEEGLVTLETIIRGTCDKSRFLDLVEKLREKIHETEVSCARLGAHLNSIQGASGFELIRQLDDAVEAILASEESKRSFLTLSGLVERLFRAILPDSAAGEFGPMRKLIAVIAEKIRSLDPEVDISGIMSQVETLLDESVAAEAYVIRDVHKPVWERQHDLSKIDFDALRKKFESGRKRTEIERLKTALERKVREMVALNRTRMDYLERFLRLIEEYNSGAHNVEAMFDELLNFANSLNKEEWRHMAENLTEEELAVFDLLTKPEIELTGREREDVKKGARNLLERLKQKKLVIDWRKREQSRAAVRQLIEIALDEFLPRAYSKDVYELKCERIYQHVYDSYAGQGRSMYNKEMVM